MALSFNPGTPAGLKELDSYLASRSYITGCASDLPAAGARGAHLPAAELCVPLVTPAVVARVVCRCGKCADEKSPQLRRLARRPGGVRRVRVCAGGGRRAARGAVVQPRDGAAGQQARAARAAAACCRLARARLTRCASFPGKPQGVSVSGGAAPPAAAAAAGGKPAAAPKKPAAGSDDDDDELDLFGDATPEEKAAQEAKAAVVATAKARAAAQHTHPPHTRVLTRPPRCAPP